MRIEEALEKFLIQLEADGRSIHTRLQYRRHVRLFAAWARDVGGSGEDIALVDHEVVARFLASPVATGSARGGTKQSVTTNALRSSLRNFLRYCHQSGMTTTDSGRLVRRARCSPPPPRAISEDDQRKLIATLAAAKGPEAERDHALFHLLLATGIRLGSAIALDVEDVFLDKSEIRIRTAKDNQPEVVYLNAEIKAHLKQFLVGRTTGPLFSANRNRISKRHIQRRLGQWLEKAGVTAKVCTHSLRHAFAMRVYARTGDVLIVKSALRHRSIASTMVYARVSEERLRAAL